jgi:hypothetical protein
MPLQEVQNRSCLGTLLQLLAVRLTLLKGYSNASCPFQARTLLLKGALPSVKRVSGAGVEGSREIPNLFIIGVLGAGISNTNIGRTGSEGSESNEAINTAIVSKNFQQSQSNDQGES